MRARIKAKRKAVLVGKQPEGKIRRALQAGSAEEGFMARGSNWVLMMVFQDCNRISTSTM
jgi:hypothetical protein